MVVNILWIHVCAGPSWRPGLCCCWRSACGPPHVRSPQVHCASLQGRENIRVATQCMGEHEHKHLCEELGHATCWSKLLTWRREQVTPVFCLWWCHSLEAMIIAGRMEPFPACRNRRKLRSNDIWLRRSSWRRRQASVAVLNPRRASKRWLRSLIGFSICLSHWLCPAIIPPPFLGLWGVPDRYPKGRQRTCRPVIYCLPWSRTAGVRINGVRIKSRARVCSSSRMAVQNQLTWPLGLVSKSIVLGSH